MAAFNPTSLNQPNSSLQSLYQGLAEQKSTQTNPHVEGNQQALSTEPSSTGLNGKLNQLAEPDPTLTKLAPTHEFSASTVAGNVLQFVAGRLATEAVNGASEERLSLLFDQALAGVQQGLGEAREALDALGQLSTTIDQGIDDAYHQIESGLDRLRQTYLPADEPESTVQPVQKTTEPAVSGALFAAHSQSTSYLSQQDFSFQVTTREGDVVSIQASALQAYHSFMARSENNQGGRQTFAAVDGFEYYQHQQFQLAIEGELNQDERAAINDLLNDVFSLASDFYQGDLSTAFDKALSLGFDTSQLQNFALNLRSTEVQQVTETYQSVAGLPSAAAGLKPLADYADQLQQTYVKAANHFEHPVELLRELLTKAEDLFADEDIQVPRLAEVTQQLLEQLTS